MSPHTSLRQKITDELASKAADLPASRMLRDPLFKWFLIPSIILCLAIILLLVLNVRPKDFVVPLQYSSIQGFDVLGPWYHVILYGLFSLLITAGNLVLASFVFEKSRITSFFLVMGTAVVNLLILRVVLTLVAQLNL